MTDSSSQRGTGGSESSGREYPDRSVLGGEVGLWTSNLDSVPAPQAKEVAAEIEELGYASLWFGEALGREAFTNASMFLCATSRLVVATGIATSSLATPGRRTPRQRRSRGRTRRGSSWGSG